MSFRHQVSVEADCNILDHEELRALEHVKVVNLSQTGLCLHASEMLPQGITVELTFTLPRTDVTVQLVGKVIWAHVSGRGGIKFCDLSSAEQQKTQEWHESAIPELQSTPA